MPTADQVIEVALREVGYVEQPGNRTKYGRWYGMDGQPYCAMFLSWCFAQVGGSHLVAASTSKGFAYTPSGAAWFKKQGRWGSEPRKGALVFFNFNGTRIHHVGGLVIAGGPPIETVEGNTSRGSAGSQRDGGGVWRRRRSSGIVGYGYPAYDLSAPPSSPPPTADDRYRAWPGNPSRKFGGYNREEFSQRRDGNVEWIQARLNGTGAGLVQDGKFGNKTHDAVVGFQSIKGLKADGIVGPKTWERLKGW